MHFHLHVVSGRANSLFFYRNDNDVFKKATRQQIWTEAQHFSATLSATVQQKRVVQNYNVDLEMKMSTL